MAQKSNKSENFWQELKRRKVVRVTTVYAATAFIILQLVDIIAQPLQLPSWTLTLIIVLLCIGLIITIIVSWVYDITPSGVKKTKPVSTVKHIDQTTTPASNGWKIATYISGAIIIALIAFNYISRRNLTADISKLEKSIAVLPFENLSSDKEQLWFSNGITDVIINQLSKISGLRVLGRTSTLKYKEEKKSIPEIGKELGVNFIIEGTVQKQGDKIRISSQLIRVRNETHIWSDLYDKQWGEIFNIQIDIAKNIANNLKTILTPEETKKIENIGTDNGEAYRLYLIGNFLMLQSSEEAYKKAIDNYQQAIGLDSSFAQPYAGLASAYLELAGWMVSSPSSEFIPKARDCALKALEIDENLGEGYFMLGYLDYLFKWNWVGAEQAFRKGIGLTPNYIYGRLCYANFLTAMGQFKESIEIGQQTLKLNPLDPIAYNELAYAMFFNGQDKEALELFNISLSLDPNYGQTLSLLDWFYLRKGIFNQAISHWGKLMESSNNDFHKITAYDLNNAGEAMVMAGRRDEALNILNELKRRTEEGDSDSPVKTAYLLNALGEEEKAIDFLEIGFNEKSPSMVWIKVDFAGDSIKSNMRFKELLRKMGFNE